MSKQRLPRIDKSRIIEDFWSFEPVVEAEKWLQNQLLQPGYLDKLYVHEGAHLYYIRQIHPAATIRPPAVYYHPLKRKYLPLEAAIDFNGINKTCDRARLITFAKGTFAGGVLEGLHLIKQNPNRSVEEIVKEIGDTDDHTEFAGYCREIRDASPGLEFDADQVRREAIEKVAGLRAQW